MAMESSSSSSSVEISVEDLMNEAGKEFEDDFGLLEMHRFPTCLRGLGDRYIVPMLVAIGPYHRGADHLQKMEEVKRAAAFHLSKRWGGEVSPDDVYKAVLGEAGRARKLYADHVQADRADPGFVAMMFFDACFLLYYMEAFSGLAADQEDVVVGDALLKQVLFSNRGCIDSDIMLLENQLPWLVLQTVIDSLPPKKMERYIEVVGAFVARMGRGFRIIEGEKTQPCVWGEPQPPHLLGLLRSYKLGGEELKWKKPKHISACSAMELAEIGVKLTATKTALFTDMKVKTRYWPVWGKKLSLAPLSLNGTRACCLVNMAAFEVATVSSYLDHPDRTAVCSYLALFSMFMLREEDVLELRKKGILHGNKTNADMLTFFKSVVGHLPDTGRHFAHTMACIAHYKEKRWMWTKAHKLVYNNYGAIITVLTILGTLVGIFQAFLALH